MINTEACPPQRIKPTVLPLQRAETIPVYRPTPSSPPAATTYPDNRAGAVGRPIGDGIPNQSWGGPLVAPRDVAVEKTISRQKISIAADKAPKSNQPLRAVPAPDKSSSVRPIDVTSFQKIGSPYQVLGTWYVPAHEPDYDETGIASWYGEAFQGRRTANGEIFDMGLVTAAHPTLPIPSIVEVTNLANGRSLMVRINDRGPFIGGRVIDMSARGAQLLGFKEQGHTNVRVRYVGAASEIPLTSAQTAEPADATAPLSEAAPPNNVAFVQMGAFRERENAQRLREQSLRLGRVVIEEAPQPDGSLLYRVMLSGVPSVLKANAQSSDQVRRGTSGTRVLASLD
jgi:rare lipoprotein A